MYFELSQAELRPWRAEDAPSLQRHANSEAVARNLRDAFPHPYTLADAERFIAAAPPTYACIAIAGEAVGGIGLTPGHDVERFSAELGYWLGEAFWGRGIVTEAVRAVTAHALSALGLERVFAMPYAGNRSSCRVLEKCGYAREARLRSAVFKGGRFSDQLLYARVRGAAAVTPAEHVLTILAVPDLARAVAFYDTALGWPHTVDTAVYVELEQCEQRLGLYQREGFAKNTNLLPVVIPDGAIAPAELYFRAADLDATIAALERAGARLLSPRAPRPWGEDVAYFADPFGHVLAFTQSPGSPPPSR